MAGDTGIGETTNSLARGLSEYAEVCALDRDCLWMVRRLERGERSRNSAAARGLRTITVWQRWRRYRQEREAGLLDRSNRRRDVLRTPPALDPARGLLSQ